MLLGDFRQKICAGFKKEAMNMMTPPKHMIRFGDFTISDFELIIFLNLIFQVWKSQLCSIFFLLST